MSDIDTPDLFEFTIHSHHPPTAAHNMDHIIVAATPAEAIRIARTVHRRRLFELTEYLVGVEIRDEKLIDPNKPERTPKK